MENLAHARQDPRFKVYDIGGDILQSDILEAAMQGMEVCSIWQRYGFCSAMSFPARRLM